MARAPASPKTNPAPLAADQGTVAALHSKDISHGQERDAEAAQGSGQVDGGSGNGSRPVGKDQDAGERQQKVTAATVGIVQAPTNPPNERFKVQAPTVTPEPTRAEVPHEYCCGNCPYWHLTNSKFPFGQCLPAIKALGAPLYRSDFDGCSLTLEQKTKIMGR